MSRYTYLAAAIFAPLCSEILTGNTKLDSLQNPLVWIFGLLPYSLIIVCLTYVCSRTQTLGNRIFLLPIPGLVIEGLLTKSFFDTSFPQLSELAGVGYWAHVQWPWTLSLIATHAMTSFVIPLALATFFARDTGYPSKKTAHISGMILGFLIVAGFMFRPASPYAIELFITLLVICVCVCLSWKLRVKDSLVKSKSGIWFAVAGFLFPILNWCSSFFLAERGITTLIFFQFLFLIFYIWFIRNQLFNPQTSDAKRRLFACAVMIPFIVTALIFGFTVK